MLSIEPKHHFTLPLLTTLQPMRFSPVVDDDDELTEAIAKDSNEHDDDWQLEETPDTNKLYEFWSEVESDVANDPNWFTFAEE